MRQKNHNSFHANSDELQIFIDELATKYDSKSEMFNDIFTKIKENEINLDKTSIREQLDTQKLENSKLDNSLKKSKLLNQNIDTELKKSLLAEYNRRGLPLPKPLKLEKEKLDTDYSKNPLEKEGLRCVDCGHTFVCSMDSQKDRLNTIESYIDHIVAKHKRMKFYLEEEVKIQVFRTELEVAT